VAYEAMSLLTVACNKWL